MSAGTPVQPDYETMSGDWTVYKNAIEGSIKAASRIAWMFAPHEQDTPNMTVRVNAGAIWADGALVEKAGQNTGAIAAPAVNPRIDRVVIDDATGVVSVITGVEGAVPVAPAITAGKLPVCQVALAISTTAITNGLITDERVLGGASGEAIKVGGVYLETLAVNPATTLGYGTWELAQLLRLESSAYPPAYSDTYVKATTTLSTSYYPHFSFNPGLLLTGIYENKQWLSSAAAAGANQRLHVDLGSAKRILRIYYENSHNGGVATDTGAKNFTLWGSNDAGAFAELTYSVDTNWTQLTCGASAFDQHVASDIADPKFITVEPATIAYRYYAFKFADNWGDANYIGVRHIELQAVELFDWKRTA